MSQMTSRLTEADAVTIWLRHWTGEYQHQIAANLGVNQGRVNEVLKRHKFVGSEIIAAQRRSEMH